MANPYQPPSGSGNDTRAKSRRPEALILRAVFLLGIATVIAVLIIQLWIVSAGFSSY
ncbi:MAG: hypothetical protein KatS3mg110_3500 [Pirellulaceae bacterium]|nr:MAG: hypothetical protein KatS3mg110_3500 [Pirellulaceae bacterium]